jgi:hypothetical protein
MAGVDEGRRPAHSRGRLLPPFDLLFLLLPFYPSPATERGTESPAMAASGEDGGGQRRHRPPRRCERSPEGERATVEWLGGGTSRPCPSHRRGVIGPASPRLAIYKTRGMHRGDSGVVTTVGEAFEGLSLSVHFSLVDLGLGF